MSAVHCPTELSLGHDHVAVGHPQVCHPVQGRASDQQLRRLSRKAASTDSFAKDRLDSKDLRLGQRATMIFALTFPPSAPLLPDLSQVLITHVSFGKGVAMLPNLRPLLWRDAGPRLSFSNGVITVATVIRTIGCDLTQLIIYLLQQVRQQLRILKIIGRDGDGH